MRTPGLFIQYIQAAGQRIADDPLVPPECREALARQAELVLWDQWQQIFGGDRVRVDRRVRIYVRASDHGPREAEERQERIAQALVRGCSYAEIARAEGVHKSTVLRFARRLVAQ